MKNLTNNLDHGLLKDTIEFGLGLQIVCEIPKKHVDSSDYLISILASLSKDTILALGEGYVNNYIGMYNNPKVQAYLKAHVQNELNLEKPTESVPKNQTQIGEK